MPARRGAATSMASPISTTISSVPLEVDVSGVKFESGPERLWGGVGLGGSYNWNNDKYSVYAEVSANTSLENFGNSYTVNGTAGFRVGW